MKITYEPAPDIEKKAHEIVGILGWSHISLDDVGFIRSHGSKSRGTIARCHALGKAMQKGMKRNKSFYVIEVISKRFDKLSPEDNIKTIIHELMHIPKSFGGGFKHHDYVTERTVSIYYNIYLELKDKSLKKYGI